MGRVLLEGGIVVLLVLIGISIFIPNDGSNINEVIVEFEDSIGSGNIVNDGEIENVEVSKNSEANFIARVNGKIANTIVDGLNSIFEFGVKFLRKIIN